MVILFGNGSLSLETSKNSIIIYKLQGDYKTGDVLSHIINKESDLIAELKFKNKGSINQLILFLDYIKNKFQE